jgi:flagellar assembly protein FliH
MNHPTRQTAWERWELGSLDEAAGRLPDPLPLPESGIETAPPLHLPTAAEIEEIQQQARTEGYAEGYEEGKRAGFDSAHAEGQAEIRVEAEHLATAAKRLEQAIDGLNTTVADELLALALELAREVTRKELALRPEIVLDVVREALSHLPHQHAAIYLHPDDASLLRSYAGDQLSHAGHRIHEDAKLSRGDCLLESGGTQLDATVAMRWHRVVENLGLDNAWEPVASVESAREDGS